MTTPTSSRSTHTMAPSASEKKANTFEQGIKLNIQSH